MRETAVQSPGVIRSMSHQYPPRTKVLIADDHQLFAESVRWALEESGLDVTGVATSTAEAVALTAVTRPDVVLIDALLPDGDGIEAGRAILREFPGVVVIAVSSATDKETMAAAFGAGFSGYVSKEASLEKLVARITGAVSGIDATRSPEPRQSQNRNDHATLVLGTLTRREREILALLADGATGNAIADQLGLSRNTVRTHVQNILTKLQVGSRLEAAAFAVENGLVPALHRSGARAHASA